MAGTVGREKKYTNGASRDNLYKDQPFQSQFASVDKKKKPKVKGVANLKKTTGRHEKYLNYANMTDAQTNIVNENKRLTRHESDQICQF